ncbi:ATPase-like protein [Thozetella sp. PMI_491]|nr:ATPase-like protein [Thozetella sp. PMI_491]
MDFSDCLADDSFGPIVVGCRDNFDFTVRFEQIFLSIVPNCLYIACSFACLAVLVRRPSIIEAQLARWLKLLLAITYSALQLAILIHGVRGGASTLFAASAAISLTSSLSIVSLSSLEHSRSPRPSVLLCSYLLLTLLFDIVQTRTLWLSSFESRGLNSARMYTSATAIKAILLVLEAQNKTKWLTPSTVSKEDLGPEGMSSIFGLSSYTWLNKLFFMGYKKILAVDDLITLDQHISSEVLQERLLRHWNTPGNAFVRRRFRLAATLARTLLVPLLLPVAPRIALTAFKFCQPFLIAAVLQYLNQPEDKLGIPPGKNVGYGLISAAILVYTGIAVSTAFYWYFHERALCMARGALVGAVYHKTTTAYHSSDSAALTLMSTDIERIRQGFLNIHELWANAIEVAIASWLLERQLGGVAIIPPLAIVLVCILCSGYINTYTSRRQKTWMGKIERRVALTADTISNIKPLKLSGLTRPIETLIQHMRVDELATASKFRTVYVTAMVFGYVPAALSPVVMFAVTARTLDVSTIFVSISYLLLLTDPLTYLFINAPHFISALACIGRIQKFLERESRVDRRVAVNIDPKSGESSPTATSAPRSSMEQTKPLVKIKNGSFGWESGNFCLKNMNIEVPAGALTLVVGPVASGKSTLCKALLGEVPLSNAHVVMDQKTAVLPIGYCDQSPSLSNTSIRNNITAFTGSLDEKRYHEVLAATMLLPDLKSLPLGDKTKIGSNGVTLSGGQRQRVSIARALYLNSSFYIFDDILSGLDADTSEQLFRRVFGKNGILRRRNATVILCTTAAQYLPSADHIIVLGGDAVDAAQGTYLELRTSNEYIGGLVISSAGIQHSEKSVTEYTVDEHHGATKDECKRPDPADLLPVTSSHVNDRERMMGSYMVYRHYLASLGRRSIAAFIIFGLGWGFFYNWATVWLKYWSSDLSSGNPSRTNSFYIGLYGLFQSSYLLSLLFCYMVCYRTMVATSGARLHKAALSTMFRAPLRYFASTDIGVTTNLFSQDMTLVDNELPVALTNVVMDIFNAIGMACVIASSSPFLVIGYPFIFAALYIIQKFYLRTSRQLRLLDLEAKGPLYTHFIDTMRGIMTFRAFGWISEGTSLNHRLLDRSQRAYYLLAMVQRWLGFALQIVVAVIATIVVVLATQLRSGTALTGASLLTLMTFGDILNFIIRWFTQLETSIGAINRLKSFSEKVESEHKDGEDFVPPQEWPEAGHIAIKGISASYRSSEEKASRNTPLALNNLNVVIQPGEKVAICGRSGSGKSSTLLLLLRLLEPESGSSGHVSIDDIPLRKISRDDLRERIISIPQDPIFVPGECFQFQLDPWDISTEDQCRDALETVQLWYIIADRGGLKGIFHAESLSHGQRQLFSLARAILRRRVRAQRNGYGPQTSLAAAGGGILLLDEVSSSVDQHTDREMQRLIHTEFRGYTVLMVSHRLEMVMNFDTVIVMENGAVIEAGKPNALMDTPGSRLKELWKAVNRD